VCTSIAFYLTLTLRVPPCYLYSYLRTPLELVLLLLLDGLRVLIGTLNDMNTSETKTEVATLVDLQVEVCRSGNAFFFFFFFFFVFFAFFF
jgi:hypothetical protein